MPLNVSPDKFDDVEILVRTFPWWKRAVAWCLWKTPIRLLLRRRFVNPYGFVIGIVRVKNSNPPHNAKK